MVFSALMVVRILERIFVFGNGTHASNGGFGFSSVFLLNACPLSKAARSNRCHHMMQYFC
jgi:hypothetical protein